MRKDNSFTMRVSSEDLLRWKAFAEHFKYKSVTQLVVNSVGMMIGTFRPTAKKGKKS